AYFHEEETSDAKALELRGELAILRERKKEIQLSIKKDIVKLLEKRKILLELKSKKANLGGTIEWIMEDLEILKFLARSVQNFYAVIRSSK
ncbi:hypothetical protein A2U01_0079975, partial [Trifolium medium]|nr:hypothetical protein [Trifolium medium]